MVEIIVSALIFSIAVAGMFATISSLQKPAEESREDISAAYVGKQILEDLRKEIDAETWDTLADTGALDVDPGGAGTCPGAPGMDHNLSDLPGYAIDTVTIDSITYTPTYRVDCDPGGTAGKKVTLDIAW